MFRKIKCNRLRPTCEACQIFQCPCIYGKINHQDCDSGNTDPWCSDAVPKKRGPKTDVLEALLKRVDGLEKRLHDENKPEGSAIVCENPLTLDTASPTSPQEATERPKSEPAEMPQASPVLESPALLTPTESLYELIPFSPINLS